MMLTLLMYNAIALDLCLLGLARILVVWLNNSHVLHMLYSYVIILYMRKMTQSNKYISYCLSFSKLL